MSDKRFYIIMLVALVVLAIAVKHPELWVGGYIW